jgi:class 3 adenylate cyclase
MKSLYTNNIQRSSREEVFCLYGDLTNFSKISKSSLTEEVSITSIREFYELCIINIQQNTGTLLCFMGDGFLAVWGKKEPPENVIKTIKAITNGTAKLVMNWKKNTDATFDFPLGIKYGACLAHITFFLDKGDRILNSFGNQLNVGARLQAAKENKNNAICCTPPAFEWLRIKINSEDKMEITVNVKGDAYSAMIVSVSDI